MSEYRIRRCIFCLTIFCVIASPIYAEADVTNGTSANEAPSQNQDSRYPTNLDSIELSRAFANPDAYNYHVAAVEGIVRGKTFNTRGQPIIEIQIDGDERAMLWLSWATPEKSGLLFDAFVPLGARIRGLGWLAKPYDWQKVWGDELPLNPSLFMLSVCLVQIRSMDSVSDQKYLGYCEGWERGIFPPNMRGAR